MFKNDVVCQTKSLQKYFYMYGDAEVDVFTLKKALKRYSAANES